MVGRKSIMTQKLSNYKEKSKEGYMLEVDIQYPETLDNVQNNLPFLPDRMNIEKLKLVANLLDKNVYLAHIRNWKQALNHTLGLKKVHRVIKFNWKLWQISYIKMNTELRKKSKKSFQKIPFQVDQQFSFWENYGKLLKT